MKFQLESGREVRISDFVMSKTYAGVMHCSDSMLPSVNEKLLYQASYPTELWGENRKEIYPKLTAHDIHQILPPYKISIWLNSKPTDPNYMGSELILTFFTEIDPQGSILDIVTPFLEDMNWEKEARNYNF